MSLPHQDPTQSSVPVAKATVLVVDDEAILRSTARRALSRRGYRILEAQDLEEAVREFSSADPKVDVVILDMLLPGGGPSIFRELREIVPDIPVIVSSGFAGDEPAAVAQLLAEDRVDFLPKPYELEELFRVVDASLKVG